MNANRAVIIMAKAPEAGKVKTRLQPFLSPEKAAEFAACLLHDVVNNAKTFQNQLIIAYSPAGKRGFFERFTDHKTLLFEQIGGDLGRRMYSAFEFAFGQGADSIVMIGTDSPTLKHSEIMRAFEFLESGFDVVLGKTDDGGFYLIGLRKLHAGVFENVEWSSEETHSQTVRNIKRAGLKLSEVAECYDIDLPDDLIRCRDELRLDPNLAAETCKWFKANENLF